MSTVNPELQKIQQAIDEQKVQADIQKDGIQEVRLETGAVFKGTPAQIQEQLQKSVVEGSRTITQTKQQLEQLQQEIANLKAAQPKDQTVGDNTEYFSKWAKSPEDATIEAVAKKMGMTPEQYLEGMKRTMQSSFVSTAASEFQSRCPDFPESPENGLLLAQAHKATYGNDPTSMTADNLELTYHRLVREGKLVPRQVTISGTMNQPTPLPNLRGSSAPPSPDTDMLTKFSSMTEEQQASVLAQLRKREFQGA